MDERKWQEMRELDEAAERAGGYVALPWTLPPNPQGEKEFTAMRRYSIEMEKPISAFAEGRLLCNWYKRPFFIKYSPLLDAEGLLLL